MHARFPKRSFFLAQLDIADRALNTSAAACKRGRMVLLLQEDRSIQWRTQRYCRACVNIAIENQRISISLSHLICKHVVVWSKICIFLDCLWLSQYLLPNCMQVCFLTVHVCRCRLAGARPGVQGRRALGPPLDRSSAVADFT
jgi:hypothetical protein